MAKKIKYGKISIAFFLTALIWVWADLAQDERLDLYNVVITVAKSSDPALWVSFVVEGGRPDLQTSVTLDTVVLKGPASRVAEVRRLNNTGTLDLDLFLAPDREGPMQEGDNAQDVLDFLKQNDEIRKLGLTVESCEPRTLTVRMRKLVRTNVPVECVGLDPSMQVTLTPSQVEAFVPDPETSKATIVLTPAEQAQARNAPVEKIPYIQLAPGQPRDVSTKVKVKLAPAENVLDSYSVTATLGLCFSQNLQGKYQVVLDNDNDPALVGVLIRATPAAYKAYSDATYHMILHIHDADRQQESVAREVVFTFPEEYVRRDEIRADRPAPVVKFRLVPISGAALESEL